MFVKTSLRDRPVFFKDFVGMALIADLLLLPPSNCFFRLCFPTFFAALLKNFYQCQHLHFLVQQTPALQHTHILQLGRQIHAKMVLRFFQYLVKLHQIPFRGVN